MRSELLAAGFEVLTIADPAGDPTLLEAIAQRTDSSAAISVVQPPGNLAADVWISDRVTGKTLLRHVRPERVAPEAPSIIAIRAVELLRASFLELNEAHPPRGEATAAPALRAWVAPPPVATVVADRAADAGDLARSRWSFAASAAGIGGPGGLPVGLAPAVSVSWRASSVWAGELFALGPALGTVETSVGNAKLDQELFASRVRFEMVTARTRFTPFLVGGFGVYHLGARGAASEPYVASSGHAWAGLAIGGLGLSAWLSRSIGLVAEIDALVMAPRPVVHFVGQDPLYGGRPTLLGTFGGEVAW